jgi:hypothetical protein
MFPTQYFLGFREEDIRKVTVGSHTSSFFFFSDVELVTSKIGSCHGGKISPDILNG